MKRVELVLARGLLSALLLAVTPWASAAELRLDEVLGATQDRGFARADSPRTFVFPEDHGPHPRYRSEWWYLTATLASDDGDEYGLQFTLFRQALRPEPVIGGPWDASQIWMAHVALTDAAGGRHIEAERLARGHPRLAGARAAPFEAYLEDWRLQAEGPGLAGLRLQAETDEFAAALRLEPQKPVVLQGEGGLSAKGPGQASYYYSVSRLTAAGEIRHDDETVAVRGNAWLDREWSTSVLGDDRLGWDWFALQLETGEDLMLFQLRNERGVRDPYDQGLWVGQDGVTHPLRAPDFTLEPLRQWRDDDGVAWPVAWRVAVMGPPGSRVLEVRAAVDDQRMDTLLTYWEGMVRVYDEDGRRIGAGYLEMTGYR